MFERLALHHFETNYAHIFLSLPSSCSVFVPLHAFVNNLEKKVPSEKKNFEKKNYSSTYSLHIKNNGLVMSYNINLRGTESVLIPNVFHANMQFMIRV